MTDYPNYIEIGAGVFFDLHMADAVVKSHTDTIITASTFNNCDLTTFCGTITNCILDDCIMPPSFSEQIVVAVDLHSQELTFGPAAGNNIPIMMEDFCD